MNIKKLIKEFLSIIFFTIILILLNSFLLKVDAASFSGTAGDLIKQATTKEGKEKYFEMDSEALVKRYNIYNGRNMKLDGTEEDSLGETVYCLGNIQGGGQGNAWRIGAVIDVDGQGNVTVYGYDGSSEKVTKTEVAKARYKKYFNTLAALYSMARNEKNGISYDDVHYYWHLRIAQKDSKGDSLASRCNIATVYIPSAVTDGKEWNLDEEIEEVEKTYDGSVITSMKGIKTRLTLFYVIDGQQRIVGGTLKDNKYKITLKKTDTDTGKPLPNAKFNFYEGNTCLAEGLTTDKNGEIIIINSGSNIVINHGGTKKTIENKSLTKGKTYKFEETEAPNMYELPANNVLSKELTGNELEFAMKNKAKYMRLKIVKVDSETKKMLPGAVFNVLDINGNKVETATTDSDGTWVSGGLYEIGQTYEIVEIAAPSGYKKLDQPIKVNITKNSNDEQFVFVTTISNELSYEPEEPPIATGNGLVKVLEINGSETSIPVEGLKFGIKNWEPDNKEYKVDGKREPQKSDSKYWDNVYYSRGYWEEYTEIETDKNGNKKEVKKTRWVDTSYYNYEYVHPELYIADLIEWKDWKRGNEYYHKSQSNYMATAISQKNGTIELSGFRADGSYTLYEIGSNNTYFEVEGAPKLIMSGYRDTTKRNIPNERTYVDIEGNVFLDGQEGKQSTRNNVFDAGEGINGVKVTLKKGGEILSIASGTDSKGNSCDKGHYKFWGDINNLKIKTKELSQYTIEFEYNGLKYESVPQTNIGKGNGSKAIENSSERNEFNRGYSQVTAKSQINGGVSSNLATQNGQTIEYKSAEHKSEVIYKSSNSKYDDIYYANDKYHITANTREAGLDLSQTGTIDGYPYDPTKDTIVDVNFGIYEREHPDIAIASDLVAAETSINGYSQVYQYQKRYDQIDDGSAYTVQIKASDATYNQTYERKLYKSDVEYAASTNDDSELAIYLTYRISIKNQSSSINVTVNDLVNYFSKDFSDGIIAVGTGATVYGIDSMGNNKTFAISNTDGIQVSEVSEDSGYSKQYITLNKEIGVGSGYQFFIQFEMKKEAIIKTLQGEVTFDNIAELNTCSAKHQNGQIWTAVDSDSAVGNCVPSNKATLEDDTDYAPSIKILIDELNERTINGIVFEDSTSSELKTNEVRNGNGTYETGEKGVENVTVQLIDLDRGTIAYSNNEGTNVKSTTDGNYAVHGFIPGNYIIKYTYGNGTEKYTAQQYKSTIYVDKTRAENYYGNGYHNGSTTGNAYWYLEDGNSRKSDAVDNYNGEMTTMYNISSNLVNKTRTDVENIWKQGDGFQHILNGTNIDKTLGIDAYTPYLAMPVEKAGTQGGAYTISNVDFGIVERARYKVKLEKVINRIQIIRADGSYLRDFTDFNNPPANTKAIPSQRGRTRGFVQFEIDTELLQTTTLLVEYGFRAENISEVEYVTEDYYKYGTIPGDKENTVVRLSIANIIDYVDNELQYADSNHMISEGNTNDTNQSNSWATIDLSKSENKKYISQDVLNTLYKGGKCEYSTVLISHGLDNPAMLAPGQRTNTIGLSLSKTLAPTQDEMKYENLVEVVEVKKTWGRELSMEETTAGAGDGQKLGDLDPTDPENDTKVVQVKDPDSHYSETIIINPPTGANKNIIIYTILGITCFVILAGGIVLIKKKVL